VDDGLKFKLGIERSSDAIFLTEPDGTITYVNPAFEKLYGIRSAEAVGKTPRILKSGLQSEDFYRTMWSELQGKRVATVEFVNRASDGRLLNVEASANPILDDRGELVGFLAIQRDVTARVKATHELRLFRALIDHSNDTVHVVEPGTGRFVDVNERGCRDLGYTREEYLSLRIFDIAPRVDPGVLAEHLERARQGPLVFESFHRRKDGSTFPVEVSIRLVALDREYFVAVGRDISDRLEAQDAHAKLELQLRQAQKMEAVGQLAGGVAHDFNNILSIILSYASLAISGLAPGDPLREDIEEIEKAGRRAVEVTGQLLAFSRRQVLQPRVVDINDSLAQMEKMLRRLLGEDVELRMVAAPALWPVKVDPGSITQVVMNLAVNARDAMPGGGTLLLETGNVELDAEVARAHPGTSPGPHVMLAVTDTGTGMDRETLSHVFEPFFTTKDVGKGTGLGLSTVLGIVQQSGGSVWVGSEPGQGTTFKVYFPRCDPSPARHPTGPPPSAGRRGRETILLAEDDEPLRHLVQGILRRRGYEVLSAPSPVEALRLAQEHPGGIDLLITDVVMPGMNGRQLAERIHATRPSVRVLFVSGYPGGVLADRGVLEEGMVFLAKPITPEALLRKVSAVLEDQTG
jgi:PAS domain S-box-containing protein